MHAVKKRFSNFDILIGRQPVDMSKVYRKLTFCVLREVDGDKVAFNGLSGEMVKLTDAEFDILSAKTVKPSNEAAELIENWYLVPTDHDDIQLSEEYRSFLQMLSASNGFSFYTVMTTTDCNARCFYCYEMGRKRVPMSEKTANDVADFIIKSRDKSKSVYIYWYGGEPLYNHVAIDIICQRLRSEGIDYTGTILTNGYLLDKDMCRKAKDDWHITRVQIAMDGTEEIYNRSKAYIYTDGKSPFKIVMDNIEALLETGIKTVLRLNMDMHNKNDLAKLADMYAERFGGYENLYVYPAILFELEGAKRANHSDEDRMVLAKKYMEFWDYCVQKGLLKENALGKTVRHTNCIADSDASIMITPDGYLGKCDHYSETNFVGDIYSGVTDTGMVTAQVERANSHELCEGCAYYPRCIKLKKCPAEGFYLCDDAKRYIANEKLKRSVDFAYRRLIAKQNVE